MVVLEVKREPKRDWITIRYKKTGPPWTSPKCYRCGSENLKKFLWIIDYGDSWKRYLFCNDCSKFQEEYFDKEDEMHIIGKLIG